MRCLAAADALRDQEFASAFVCCDLPNSIASRIESDGHKLVRLTEVAGSVADQSATSEVADKLGSNVIVIDGYHFDDAFRAGTRAHAKLAVIDDHATGVVTHADIVLNQNIFAPPDDLASGLLFGLKYVLLRREFSAPAVQGVRQIPGCVFLSLGGSDPDGLTIPLIESLCRPEVCIRSLDVIVGGVNPRLLEIEQAASNAGIPVRVHCDVQYLAPVLATAEIAVIAAGGTMWESMCLGVPMVAVYRDAVQARSTNCLVERQLVVDACRADSATRHAVDAVARALADRRVIDDVSQRIKGLVDGRGASRFASAVGRLALQ